MAALGWLLIPVAAAVLTGAWSSWMGRRRTRTPDAAGVAGYERFRAAMERGSVDPAVDSGTAQDGARQADVEVETAPVATARR